MRNYSIVSFVCLILGWAVSIGTHAIWSIYTYGSPSGGDTGVVAFWSFLFVLIAYFFFIILPKKWIIKAVQKFNLLTFSAIMLVYAVLALTVLIGWLFAITGSFLGIFLDAATVGLVFGVTFWSYRKIIMSNT